MHEDLSLRLSEGYYLQEEADLLVLRRPDGTEVAYFGAYSATSKAIESAAEGDLHTSAEEG